MLIDKPPTCNHRCCNEAACSIYTYVCARVGTDSYTGAFVLCARMQSGLTVRISGVTPDCIDESARHLQPPLNARSFGQCLLNGNVLLGQRRVSDGATAWVDGTLLCQG